MILPTFCISFLLMHQNSAQMKILSTQKLSLLRSNLCYSSYPDWQNLLAKALDLKSSLIKVVPLSYLAPLETISPSWRNWYLTTTSKRGILPNLSSLKANLTGHRFHLKVYSQFRSKDFNTCEDVTSCSAGLLWGSFWAPFILLFPLSVSGSII